MKKKHDLHHHHKKAEVEILKAVAQAWFSHHHHKFKPCADEFDARRRNSFHGRPSRFRIEAMEKEQHKKERADLQGNKSIGNSYWDFNQSLWDPYEIVAVSKILEQGLVLDKGGFSGFRLAEYGNKGVAVSKKESRHSLRQTMFGERRRGKFDEKRRE